MATRLTLRTFKHKKRKVTIVVEMPYLYFIGFIIRKDLKDQAPEHFFFKLTLKQCPHEPFAPYLVIATPVNFLDGIFGYTSRLALHWCQICVVPFRAVKTGLSHGLNSKPSTYRPVNQLTTLMGEMNQNIIHSKNNIGSTLLSNNAASDVSEWFLERFWCCVCVCCLLSPFLSFDGVYHFTTIKI